MVTVEVPERQSNKTSCGLKQQNAFHGLENISKVLEGTCKQERMNDHEENEEDDGFGACHGNGTGDERQRICSNITLDYNQE
jgi:transcriptional regulator of heat shock response